MAAANRNKSRRARPIPTRAGHAAPSENIPDREIDPRHLDPVQLDVIRQQITNLVANRALDLVQQVLDQIGHGNYQAMKYLFEIAGLFPANVTEEGSGESSLTRMLLNYLGDAAPSDQGQKTDADAVK